MRHTTNITWITVGTPAAFAEVFSELGALIRPVAPLIVGDRRFAVSGTGTIRDGDTASGVLLDRRADYIAAILPRGICIAQVGKGHGGAWTARGFVDLDDSPFKSCVRGYHVLGRLWEAMRGVPMRRDAWRRQRIAAMLIDANRTNHPNP